MRDPREVCVLDTEHTAERERANSALGWQGAAFRFFISHFTVILRVSRRLSVVVCC